MISEGGSLLDQTCYEDCHFYRVERWREGGKYVVGYQVCNTKRGKYIPQREQTVLVSQRARKYEHSKIYFPLLLLCIYHIFYVSIKISVLFCLKKPFNRKHCVIWHISKLFSVNFFLIHKKVCGLRTKVWRYDEHHDIY